MEVRRIRLGSVARIALAISPLVALFVAAAPSNVIGAASVTLSGPTVVARGGTIELVANGTPSGGQFAFSIEPLRLGAGGSPKTRRADPPVALRVNGNRIELTGLETSAGVGDVLVRADYILGGMRSTARLALTVVDGDMTAYRPQHGAGYAPFARTAVSNAAEDDPELGPGIRINGAGETDPSGEDDLIEVELTVSHPSLRFFLERTSGVLAVWTTRGKAPGTELTFTGDRTDAFSMAGGTRTAWIEWTGAHGTARLALVPDGIPLGSGIGAGGAVDRVRLHSFRSIVQSLGGEGQVPSNPVDPNHGTYLIGRALYGTGYDVHLNDEDRVSPTGAGVVYDEVVNAIQNRAVEQVVSFGYSHGGGSTYDLVDRLNANRGAIGAFTIPFTSYVDGVENDSDFDLDMELRFPPSSLYHASHYQIGSFADFFLDGGPVPGAVPPPSGLNVETTPWGAGATHFIVDDFDEVLDFIELNLEPRVTR